MSVRYRATIDMGVRTTQSPPLLVWKALFTAGRPLTVQEIASEAGLNVSVVETVVKDPFYQRYGIMTEADWEAAHPPKPVVEEVPEVEETPGEDRAEATADEE